MTDETIPPRFVAVIICENEEDAQKCFNAVEAIQLANGFKGSVVFGHPEEAVLSEQQLH